nr:hypothetical protein StreXyl84_07280 [Streptomyces sp. Xyl84]
MTKDIEAPPAAGATAGPGIDQALLGKVTRTDGTGELTIVGRPAPGYAEDTEAGQVDAQGVGGTRYALAPTA